MFAVATRYALQCFAVFVGDDGQAGGKGLEAANAPSICDKITVVTGLGVTLAISANNNLPRAADVVVSKDNHALIGNDKSGVAPSVGLSKINSIAQMRYRNRRGGPCRPCALADEPNRPISENEHKCQAEITFHLFLHLSFLTSATKPVQPSSPRPLCSLPDAVTMR